MATTRPDIRSHHAIRGIAAFLVFVLHLQEVLIWGSIDLYRTTSFVAKGYLWVDCFFILSGFILSYVYADTFGTLNWRAVGRSSISFLKARFARVYPLHLFALLSMLGLRAVSIQIRDSGGSVFWGDNTPETLLVNMLLLQSWELQNSSSWNNPSWSISTEALAYLLFPFLCVTRFRMPKIFLGILILAPPLGYSLLLYVNGSLDCTFHLGLLRCLSGFILGMALFGAWRLVSPLTPGLLLSLQPAIFPAILLAMHADIGDAIILPMFAALVLLTADDLGPVARILQWGPLIWLGMRSYSIYMIHFPIVYFAAEMKWFLFDYWIADDLIRPTTLSIGLFFFFGIGVLALSTITYRFVEIPMRARLSGHGKGATSTRNARSRIGLP